MAAEPTGPAAHRDVGAPEQASDDAGGDVHGEKNFMEDATHLQEHGCLASLSTSSLSTRDAESELSADRRPICSENVECCAQEPAPTADDKCGEQDVNGDVPSGDGTRVKGERRSSDHVNRKEEMRKENGDEDERSTKIGDAIKFEDDLNPRSLGGWGEKIGLDVITAFPMYEARTRLDAEDDEEVVRRFAIFSEERCSREALSRRGGKRRDPLCDEVKVPRSRSRYKQLPLDEDDDTQRALGKRWRGTVCESPKRESPDIALVHNVVDNLIEEFEASPILKKPQPRLSSSPRRRDRSPPRRTSPARTRSSPVRSPKRSPPRSPGAVSRLKSYASTVIRSRSSSDQPDEKELERVWTVCSLLESITGDVTTEARRVYEPHGDTFQTKDRALSGNADTDQISEDAFQDYTAKKSKQARRRSRSRSKNGEKTKARKTRWKSTEKKASSNYGARARRRSTSRKEEEPERDERTEGKEKRRKARGRSGQRSRREEELEDEEEPQVVKQRDNTRGRSRRTSRRDTEFESESELEIVEERNTGKYRALSRQKISEAEMDSDEAQPRRNRSKRFKRIKTVIDEQDTDGETSATEISVEDLIETDEATDATAKKRPKKSKKRKDRKVRFFTNLLLHRRPSHIAEPSPPEPREFPERRPEVLWRQHDEAIVRTSSDGTIDAEIESSQEESLSTKSNIARRSSSGKLFLTIEPRRNLRRTQDDAEDGRYSKVSKVQGIAIEIDPGVSDDDESPRQPKENYYCEVQEPSPKNDRQVINTENEIFLIDKSTSSGLVVRSQSSSDGDSIELKTDVQTCPSLGDIYQPLAVDDDQPIFRARIGRRSAMPPDEPAENEEDVRLLKTRIGRRSNASATGSVTRAASVVCTESDGRNLRHILSDDISITPAARRPSSQSVSIELELPREWSVEPCRAETTAPATVSAVLHRPHRHRRSYWPRSRSRSRHRRPRYGRHLCDFGRSSRMSRTLQLIRAATLPPCQYMCAQPPITQVYTSLSSPAPPPLYPPPVVPPACMEPNLRFEHRRYRRAPPTVGFPPAVTAV
ncbi:hypothetical protein MTO96_000154 [Rhipicephalus appendiculatus]